MKSIRRQQKDIDKARGRLIGWINGSREGVAGIDRAVDTLVLGVAQRSGHSPAKVKVALSSEPFTTATRILAMFMWLTGDDDADRSKAPLARYMSERGWREASVGRRWLQQLAESRFESRLILGMKPGTSVRLSGTREAAEPITVHEPHLANNHSRGLVLVGRVLPMPAGAVLVDGFLLLEPLVSAALPPRIRPSEAFAIWAAGALVHEGLLPDKPRGTQSEPPGARPSPDNPSEPPPNRSAGSSQASTPPPQGAEEREKLLSRVRKLFAMAQETEASPHEAEIALRRCQSLMAKFGITEKDLETSDFGRQTAHTGKRVPMHIQFLSIAVAKLNGVLFVSGGGEEAHFRGYEIDVRVARLTLDYLSDAVERALTARRRAGDFPAGRMAAYDYRLAFADEVITRVTTIVTEREAEEKAASPTGTALTIRKLEVVNRECGQDLQTTKVRGRGAVDDAAAGAGREDGSRVSLDPQVQRGSAPVLLGRD